MPWEQSYGYAQAVRVGDTIWVSGQLFYKDLAVLFYGANRPGANVSQGILEQFWLWSMQAGLKNAYESIKAFSETDQTEDLKKVRCANAGPAR